MSSAQFNLVMVLLCDNTAASEFHHVILHVKGSAPDFKQGFVGLHMQDPLIQSIRADSHEFLSSTYDEYAEFLMVMFVQSIGQKLLIQIEAWKAECRQNNLLADNRLIVQHTGSPDTNHLASNLNTESFRFILSCEIIMDILSSRKWIHAPS